MKLIIEKEHDSYEMRDGKRRLLMKQKENPYFDRIDFVYDGEDEAEILYITSRQRTRWRTLRKKGR